MAKDVESKESVSLHPEIERSLYERPGAAFWVAVLWLGYLIGICFLVTLIFVAAGTGGFETPLAGLTLGLLPGMIFGLVTLGFTYAVHPPSALRVFLLTLVLMVLPSLIVGAAFGIRNPWVFGLAFPGLLLGWLVSRWAIAFYRRAGWGTISAPPGSWEERF